jgi:hypothetical protein
MAGVANRIGLWTGDSRTGITANISFAHHGVLFIGDLQLGRREDHNLPCPTNK